MAYLMKPNTGSLFRNDKKTTDQHPNATGQALINGVEYWVSAWTNLAPDGNKYQSLKFAPKEKQAAAAAPAPMGTAFDDMDSDIPF